MALKILVAPASYKGSIAAYRLATAMSSACRKLCESYKSYIRDSEKGTKGSTLYAYGDCEILEAPIADGGDDTLTSLHQALGGEMLESPVTGPVGQSVPGAYLRLSDVAVVELAVASGIAYLTRDTLAPLTAHTYGTGQVIERAIAGGAKNIVVTVGGSASTDGGMGALCALGARFLNAEGLPVPLGGGHLGEIASIDLSALKQNIDGVNFVVATDVTSPLLGETGAAAVFGPQKGASENDVLLLDQGLAHFASIVQSALPDINVSALVQAPGAGAAGGAGFGFASVLGARIVSGFHYLSQLLKLDEKLAWCDIVIVAEGRLDRQSLTGKGVGEMIKSAISMGKTVLVVPACSLLTSEDLTAFYRLDALAGRSPEIYLVPSAAPEAGAVNAIATEATVISALTSGLRQILDQLN